MPLSFSTKSLIEPKKLHKGAPTLFSRRLPRRRRVFFPLSSVFISAKPLKKLKNCVKVRDSTLYVFTIPPPTPRMAAKEVAGGSGRPPPPPPPTLTLPPRSAMESLFSGGAAGGAGGGGGGSSSEMSPGPLTLASSLFHDESEASSLFPGSFTQLLVGTISSPVGHSPLLPPPPATRSGVPGRPPSFSVPSPSVAATMFCVPPGLSPTALLASPGLFSPAAMGNFEMSHQQALAQVTAQAAHSQFSMLSQADYTSSFSFATSALTSQHVSSSINMPSMKEMSTLPSNTGNNNFESTEVSQGVQPAAIIVDKPAGDGYNWRKYGQKTVKGGEYPRSYYKCTHPECPVKKKVERSADGQITQIIYRGQHNHARPPKRRSKDGGGLLNESDDFNENEDASTRSEPGSQDYSGKIGRSNDGAGPSMPRRGEFGGEQSSGSSDSEEVGDDEVRADEGDDGKANAKRRNVPAPAQRIIVQTTSEVDLLDDGYRWRKYGQKVVKGNPHPRSYYKCTYQGCDVKKHIERSSADPKAVITTYEGKHNHDVPAARNSSHTTANAISSASSGLLHRAQSTTSGSQPSFRRTHLNNDGSAVAVLQLKEEHEMT